MPLEQDEPGSAVYDQPAEQVRAKAGTQAYDPQTVQPTPPSPASVSPPEDVGSTSGADGPSEEPEPLPEFDPRYIEEFQGLLYVGALRETFTWLGHQFVIRTLMTNELVEVAMIAKDYKGSDAESKAYQAAVVAGCVLTVDGKELPMPLTNDPADTLMRNRFDYVMAHWFPPTLDVLYERYFALELKVRAVIDSMGNRSG